jgi:septal ring factor EnvC (AmiA/AmiB activator)
MQTLKAVTIVSAISAGLVADAVRADITAVSPPVIIDNARDNIPADLQELKALVKSLEAKRDAFQKEQEELREQLKNATPEQREVIREQLQDNREAFLAEVRSFREEFREEVSEIKNLIHNGELQRVIDAAKDQGKGGRHKGQ